MTLKGWAVCKGATVGISDLWKPENVRTRIKVLCKFDSTCSLVAIREQLGCRCLLQDDQSVLAIGLDTLL